MPVPKFSSRDNLEAEKGDSQWVEYLWTPLGGVNAITETAVTCEGMTVASVSFTGMTTRCKVTADQAGEFDLIITASFESGESKRRVVRFHVYDTEGGRRTRDYA